MTEIDADYQDEITCPHCGEKDTDSWEHNLDDGASEVIVCDNCGGLFEVSADVSITYSSSVITPAELELRAAKRELSRAHAVERIFRHEYIKAGMPVDFQPPLIRANQDSVNAEIALAALTKPKEET